jgi:hypothetical protein
MHDRRFAALATLVLAAALLAPALAQEGLPGVDLSPLTDAQRAEAMKIFAQNGCTCGCGMTMLECRTKDPNCPRSPALAAQVVQLLAQGKPPAEVVKTVFGAPQPAPTAPTPPPAGAAGVAEYVFDVPAGDSYFLGPKDARVTLITFLDYQ